MIRLATIGTNFITDWLMEGILELDEIQLTAVYSRNLEKGKQFAAKYNVEKVYDNYEEMAKDPEIDAVYVASPTYMHYAHSITMINYGKHVLCEKPVCSNREELDILIKAAKEQGVVFMEAMKNVHSPGFHAMMDNLHKIGTVRRATIQYCQYSSRYDNYKRGIVENAFKHGVSYQKESFIRVAMTVEDGKLAFRCSNSNWGKSGEQNHGIGLENVRKRLRLLFGQDYTLSINEREGSFNVLLIIPLL